MSKLLKDAGLTIEQLNSNDPKTREMSRKQLADSYASAGIVFSKDGIIYQNTLNAAAFAESPTAKLQYLFVRFENEANVTPVSKSNATKVVNKLIPTVAVEAVKGSVVAEPEAEGLRSNDDIEDDAPETETVTVEEVKAEVITEPKPPKKRMA